MICESCEQLNAQTVQRLFELIKKKGVPAIFAETTIDPALIKTFAQEGAGEISTKSTLL
ncbi:metal ABC transporter solute-binding protein, Zn/Mn family [Nostoc sp.]|uniref:metal ABC transporter solute-binding protein, Zn/Mn family n=1 Tax=Nostoc sp. TaxID=1180 RepID=UPI003FA5AC26